jgi:hypothetical protein
MAATDVVDETSGVVALADVIPRNFSPLVSVALLSSATVTVTVAPAASLFKAIVHTAESVSASKVMSAEHDVLVEVIAPNVALVAAPLQERMVPPATVTLYVPLSSVAPSGLMATVKVGYTDVNTYAYVASAAYSDVASNV